MLLPPEVCILRLDHGFSNTILLDRSFVELRLMKRPSLVVDRNLGFRPLLSTFGMTISTLIVIMAEIC